MPKECLIQESASSLRAREGSKWAATLLTPGVGSSGIYTEEMLAEHGPTAFPKGTKLFFMHPKEGEGPGDRDPRDQWGVLESDARFEPGDGLVGEIRVLPHWKEVVESLGDQAALSIYSSGKKHEDGTVVLTHHRTNGIDMVSHPGREGSKLTRQLEAARAAFNKPDAASAQESNHQEEHHMELEKKVDAAIAAIEALTTKIDSFVSEAAEAAQAAKDAQDAEKDVAEAVKAAVAAVEAVKSAKLLPSLEKPLIEAAEDGKDVAAGIESAKAVMKEAKTFREADGSSYVHESASGDDDLSLNIGGN